MLIELRSWMKKRVKASSFLDADVQDLVREAYWEKENNRRLHTDMKPRRSYFPVLLTFMWPREEIFSNFHKCHIDGVLRTIARGLLAGQVTIPIYGKRGNLMAFIHGSVGMLVHFIMKLDMKLEFSLSVVMLILEGKESKCELAILFFVSMFLYLCNAHVLVKHMIVVLLSHPISSEYVIQIFRDPDVLRLILERLVVLTSVGLSEEIIFVMMKFVIMTCAHHENIPAIESHRDLILSQCKKMIILDVMRDHYVDFHDHYNVLAMMVYMYKILDSRTSHLEFRVSIRQACPKACVRCARSTAGVAESGRCGRCRVVQYCNRQCQMKNYRFHKTICEGWEFFSLP